jgi:dihydroorotate dehydrogenase (fumarate)
VIPSLESSYLGMRLRNPVVVAASPLGRDVDRLARLEDAGAAAVVLPSLFEEQIEHDSFQIHTALEHGVESFPEALSYLPEVASYNTGPESYLDLVARARRGLGIPVIASLNGTSAGGWTMYARLLEEAGAHALELNVYIIAADINEDSATVEGRYLETVEAVRRAVDIPLAVKVGPYFSSMANMARRLVDAGADGLVLFNRFYQPDIDLESLEVVPDLRLSSSVELRLPLRWIAILRGRIRASLAATTGVHDHFDVAKMLLAGADVTMMASALLRHGPGRLQDVVEGLTEWLVEHEYESVDQMRGSMSQESVPDPSAFERSNYLETLASYVIPH